VFSHAFPTTLSIARAPGSDATGGERYKERMSLRAGSTWPTAQLGLRGLRFLRHLPNFVRLYWRLLRDRRVSLWPKALLVLGLLYVVSPIDFIPDFIPLIGELDDLVVIIATCRLFMYMCPRAVVQEHVRRIDAGQ
jgi:uncharacterized membrane protein YkvA (DUF1232 family)